MESQLGSLLRSYRSAAGLSQEALAERSGVSAQAISALERGARRHPRQPTLGLLADSLHLDDDQRRALEAAARGRSDRPQDGWIVPRQLPLALPDFTGRAAETARLVRLLTDRSNGEEDRTVAVITGMAGAGKTALAVHVGHLVADDYPDGQIFIDLLGSDPGTPLTPHQVMRHLLRSIGGDSDAGPIPNDPEWLRSMIRGLKVLFVLDNASSSDQVESLLPALTGNGVIITSRRSGPALAAASLVDLDMLSPSEALSLLCSIAGNERVLSEIEAAVQVVRHCGYLPLAVRIAGARLAARPAWPVAYQERVLADARRRLDGLELTDHGVRAIFEASLEQLADSTDPVETAAAEALIVLGLPGSTNIGMAVIARLLDRPEEEVRQILGRLVYEHLLTERAPGRYQIHDLVHTFVSERARKVLSRTDQVAAATRLVDLYTAVAWRAGIMVRRGTVAVSWADERWTTGSPAFADSAAAMTWLDDEGDNLAEAVLHAANDPDIGRERAVRLAIGLGVYYVSRRRWPELLRTCLASLDVVDQAADPVAVALLQHYLGVASAEIGAYDEAITRFLLCLDAYRATCHERGEAATLMSISHVYELSGDPDDGIRYARQARELSRRLGDSLMEGYSCYSLGTLYGRLGEREQQVTFLTTSLAIFKGLGDRLGVANTLRELGSAHRAAGNADDAVGFLHDACMAFRQIGRPLDEASVLHHLGELLAVQGDVAGASHRWERALAIHDRHGTAEAAELRSLLEGLADRPSPASRDSG